MLIMHTSDLSVINLGPGSGAATYKKVGSGSGWVPVQKIMIYGMVPGISPQLIIDLF
jgi:hypothetical protein